MYIKYLTVLLTIIGLGLVDFPSEAAVLTTKSSGVTATTPDSTLNSEAKIPVKGRPNALTKGTEKWQIYASAADGDAGKGEMYALHVGYGSFIVKFC